MDLDRIETVTEPHYLGQDVCSARLGMFIFLDGKDARPFTQCDPVAALIKRTADELFPFFGTGKRCV